MLRLAKPGEFTKRAFENNKLELTQVKAIADIVNSETECKENRQSATCLDFFLLNRKKFLIV